jgi:hypothetical protein
MLWMVTCSLFVNMLSSSSVSLFSSHILRYGRNSCELLLTGSSWFVIFIFITTLYHESITFLLLFSETEITLRPHRVLSVTCEPLHPLRSVTFNGILGKFRPCTVGAAKLCVSHKMGFSGGPNMIRDRRMYRTASDMFHEHIRRAQFHKNRYSLISASANLKPLSRKRLNEPGGIIYREVSQLTYTAARRP